MGSNTIQCNTDQIVETLELEPLFHHLEYKKWWSKELFYISYWQRNCQLNSMKHPVNWTSSLNNLQNLKFIDFFVILYYETEFLTNKLPIHGECWFYSKQQTNITWLKIKYLAFFVRFCSVVGLEKMVTLTTNIVYKKSAQYRKYICLWPSKSGFKIYKLWVVMARVRYVPHST